MEKDKFLNLLAKKVTGDISSTETLALDEAIEQNKVYKQIAEQLNGYLNPDVRKSTKTDKLRNTWAMIRLAEQNNFKGRFDYGTPKQQFFNATKLIKIAAVLVLGIISIFIAQHFLSKNKNQNFETFSSTNESRFIRLADGTKIWLNKNSSLRYNTAFGKDAREITLKGEAYFDVVKNATIPLFIHVDEIDIEVKGTAFNVNAYQGNQQIKVALIRGLIQVTDRLNTRNKILLKPNQQLFIPKNQIKGKPVRFLLLPINKSELHGEIKWTSDTLIFKKEKLKDLAIRLEKKYEMKIEIQSAVLGEKRFSGTFTNETIQQALEALKLSYPLTYTINNRLIIIKD